LLKNDFIQDMYGGSTEEIGKRYWEGMEEVEAG